MLKAPMAEFDALEFPALSPALQRERSQAFLTLMRTRRTVREFSALPVAMELIENAVAAAASAPSGANQQPWRFAVVTDASLKQQIRAAAEQEERTNYESRFPVEWLAALEPFGTDWRKEFLEVAPVLIVVFAIDHGLNQDGTKRKHYYVQESVGIATGFLLAALHAAGLATLTHTPSPMGFLRTLLDRPSNERPFLLIPVGYPAAGCQVPKLTKKVLEEVILRR